MTKTQYPQTLDAVDMAEFTKGKSYSTGWDRWERPYVTIEEDGRKVAYYLWSTYQQVYVLEIS